MSAFFGISVWIILATVVPGLVTIAGLYLALAIANPEWIHDLIIPLAGTGDWVWAGIAITIMVITQAFGVLLERLLVGKKWLGPELREIEIPKGIDPHGETKIELKPYVEYQGLYILLAELGADEDTQGHLKRSCAQFFLTHNTLVSFSLVIIATLIIAVSSSAEAVMLRCLIYAAAMAILLVVSYQVAKIRFEVMAKALWAARRRRHERNDTTFSAATTPSQSTL